MMCCNSMSEAIHSSAQVRSASETKAERKHAHALVKSVDTGVFITAELCGQRCQQRGFARAGRPENQGVAEIAHMDIEPERRGFIRGQHCQGPGVGRIERTGADGRTRPDRSQGQKISQVQGIDHRPPQIGVSVARMRSEPRLQGVDVFNPAAEAKRLDIPAQFSRPILIREHGREGFLRQPVNGNQREMFPAEAGNDAPPPRSLLARR